ncbi:response regulator transcription factor [Terrabacter sp. C0L_2]|uniref:response regulator transcription factor n=1 Tax=Terrabacter sp. C0L_2 TaxID=3108389 RepID=UPI002ED04C17|nr:response regulator transcription factor [Terrabacter sp. C0L_2]
MERQVLVVDDEQQIRAVLRAYLEADGFRVTEAGNGTDALRLVRSEDPVLVLLDVRLPDLDGIEVLRTLRQSSQVPVILVTARSEEVDKLVGLGVGADDYVTKPFSPREIVARAKAVLRRAPRDAATGDGSLSRTRSGVLTFDGLSIDEGRREVRRGGAAVELSALEFDLLAAMARSPGRVFSRAQLLEQVWGYDFFGDERVVDVHVRNMRRALGDDAADPRVIGTVRGVGYRFLPEAEEDPR